MTLTEFLLARIADDEAQAQAEVIELEPGDLPEDFPDGWLSRERLTGDAQFPGGTAEFILTWSPRRVLAECRSTRLLVDLHSWALGDRNDPCDAHDGSTSESEDCDTLRLLAAPYDRHPDFDEAWGHDW